MTWAEFQIRSFAYNRMYKREELLAREIAWASLTGSHYNPKKLPKSIDRFWPIGNKKNTSSDKMKDVIKKAQEDYYKELKRQKNG